MKEHNLDAAPRAALYAALAKAQGEFVKIPRTKRAKFKLQNGDEVEYAYADLAALLEMVREPLSKNELAYFQRVIPDPESQSTAKLAVETVLAHSSGGSISSTHPIYIQDNKLLSPMQRLAVAETFARRYSFSMLLGVASEDDIDDAKPDGADDGEINNNQVDQAMKRVENAKTTEKLEKNRTARDLYQELLADIDVLESGGDPDELEAFGINRGPDIQALPSDWRDDVLNEYRKAAVKIHGANQDDDATLPSTVDKNAESNKQFDGSLDLGEPEKTKPTTKRKPKGEKNDG